MVVSLGKQEIKCRVNVGKGPFLHHPRKVEKRLQDEAKYMISAVRVANVVSVFNPGANACFHTDLTL